MSDTKQIKEKLPRRIDGEDLKFFRSNPELNPIDEPIYEDYLVEQIYEYGKNQR